MLLDLDGTLLDGSGLPAAMRATCAALAADLPGVSADDLVAANTAAWQRLWPDVEDDYMLGGRRGDEVGRDPWRATLEACGLEGDAVVDRAVAIWAEEERASFRLFPDVLPALEALAAAGIRVGMVTNGASVVQREKLDATGLTGRLDPLIISSEVGVKKPDPAIFEVALARGGVLAAEALLVGDHLWHDVAGAMAVGIRGVWLDRRGTGREADQPQPDATIRSLEALAV